MAPTLRIFRLTLMLVICRAASAVTSPEEANAACALENDAVASCDESGDDASRRLQGDDDDAATFCSFAGPTLAAQCDARDTCAAEYRAYLTCYYRALCEDPSLGCAPLAADDPPATAAPAPSSSPMADSCGELVPVAVDECPGESNLAACDVVACGELCEGDGECGTNDDLDNCARSSPNAPPYDVYRKYCGALTWAPTATPAPTADKCGVLEPVEPEDCPANGDLPQMACDVVACGEGQRPVLCEGDGECGTDVALNNCGGSFDIYRKICPSAAPTTHAPSSSPAPTTVPSSSPAPTATPAPSASPAPSYTPAPTVTPAPSREIIGCRRLLRHTNSGDRPEAHRLLSRGFGCSDDATAVRLGGVCAATVWLIVVAVATWLLVA